MRRGGLAGVITHSVWMWAAAALSFGTCALHVFATKKDIVQPLLDADLHRVSKYTHYYCWHMVSVTLFAMGAAYSIAAVSPSAWELAAAATVLSVAFAAWSLALVIWKQQKPFELPQWVLFIAIATTAILGFDFSV